MRELGGRHCEEDTNDHDDADNVRPGIPAAWPVVAEFALGNHLAPTLDLKLRLADHVARALDNVDARRSCQQAGFAVTYQDVQVLYPSRNRLVKYQRTENVVF